MLFAAEILSTVLVISVLIQAVLVFLFVGILRGFKKELVADSDALPATIILALRGKDPFLPACIQGMLSQDYPDFDVKMVVDCPEDSALPVVNEALRDVSAPLREKVEVLFLENPLPTCGLKCSSLIRAIDKLRPECEFVALLDADTVPHPTWLRELATGLQPENVGAATGNRWYMPGSMNAGSLVRYVWNAAAVVQMCMYNIAWGGSLAIKTRVFRETDLLDKWSNAFCDDTMLFAHLKRAKLKVKFVPSLMMVNREQCDLGGFYRWVRRQLLTARLYHPAWFNVVFHGVSTALTPAAALIVGLVALATGHDLAGGIALGGFVFYQSAVILLLPPMEFAVRRIVKDRGEPVRWIGWANVWKYIVAIPATQIVYFPALVSACFLRNVGWRGVEYQVRGPWNIKMTEYVPYASEDSESTHSL